MKKEEELKTNKKGKMKDRTKQSKSRINWENIAFWITVIIFIIVIIYSFISGRAFK